MHVVLDARYLSRLQSGVGHYTQRLVASLAAIDRTNQYTCVVVKGGPALPVAEPDAARWRRWPTRVSFDNHLAGDLWLLGYLPLQLRRLGADVYHGPAVFLPLVKLGYRTVVTIHDLVSFLFPETVPRRYSLYMRLMTRLAVRSADRIIAVSRATKDDLIRVLGVPVEKVAVIHEAVASEFAAAPAPGAVDAAVRRYGIRPPYCLFVGNLEPRKNLVRLIAAFALVKARAGRDHPPHQLVLVGTRGWLYSRIFRAVEAHGVAPDIVFTGYVPPAELPLLYAGAACFVFPSLYEGFGLPILEAMAAGTPVVAARVGAIPEVADDAALLVDPRRPTEIAEAITTLLADGSLRDRLVARGRARARSFTWESAARQTLDVYEAVYLAGGGGRPSSSPEGRGPEALGPVHPSGGPPPGPPPSGGSRCLT